MNPVNYSHITGADISSGVKYHVTLAARNLLDQLPALSAQSPRWSNAASVVETGSGQWDSTHATVLANSASWEESADINYLSGKVDQNTYGLANVSNTSGNWNSVYSTVLAESAGWDETPDITYISGVVAGQAGDIDYLSGRVDVKLDASVYQNISGNWQSTYSTVLNGSGGWDETPDITYISGVVSSHAGNIDYLSGQIDSKLDVSEFSSYSGATLSSINSLSSKLESSVYHDASGAWQSTYSTVQAQSAGWDESSDVDYLSGVIVGKLAISDFSSYSGSVNNSLTAIVDGMANISSASGNWNSVHSTVDVSSGGWSSTYSTVGPSSATWGTVISKLDKSEFDSYSGETLNSINSLSGKLDTSIYRSASGNWQSAYSTVSDNSGSWGGGALSGDIVVLSGKTLNTFTIGLSGSGANYVCDGAADEVQFALAVSEIPAGSILKVMAGSYTFSSTLDVNKSISIIGQDRTTTVINVDGNFTGMKLSAAGCVVQYVGMASTAGQTLNVYPLIWVDADAAVIKDCALLGRTGLHLNYRYHQVSRNQVSSVNPTGRAITVSAMLPDDSDWHGTWPTGLIIENNIIGSSGVYSGIGVYTRGYASSMIIKDNIHYANSYSIKSDANLSNVIITENNFHSTDADVYLAGIDSGIEITNNVTTIQFAPVNAYVLGSTSNAIVTHNVFGTVTTNNILLTDTLNVNIGNNVGTTAAPSGGVTEVRVTSGKADYTTLSNNINLGLVTLTGANSVNRDSKYDNVCSTVLANSAGWALSGGGGSDVSGLSGAWQSAYATVNSNSSTWDTVTSKLDTSIYQIASGVWQDTYSTVQTNSAGWALSGGGGGSDVWGLSGNWQSTYVTVGSNSATWGTVTSKLNTSDFNAYSGSVDSTLTGHAAQIAALSGDFSYGDTIELVYSPLNYTNIDATLSGHLAGLGNGLSGKLNASVYQGASGAWQGTYATVNSNSANWSDVYATVSSTSSSWAGGGSPSQSGDINYISGVVSSHTAQITTLSGDYSYIDIAEIAYNPVNYTEATADVSGHLNGIDVAIGVVSGEFGSADDLSILYSSTNYTAASADISGHFSGINTSLGTKLIRSDFETYSGSLSLNNYRTINVDAGMMVANVTSGALAGTEETVTNKKMVDYFSFATDVDQYVQFKTTFPDEWDRGNIKAKFYWGADTSSGDVVWGIAGDAVASGTLIDTAFNAGVTITGTVLSGAMMKSVATDNIALSSTIGDLVWFKAYRNGLNAADTLATDAKLYGIVIQYHEAVANSVVW
jgi:hypothetical protein